MKIQADVTTFFLDGSVPFYVDGREISFADALAAAQIDVLRVSFFTPASPLLSTERALQFLKRAELSDKQLYLCVHCSDEWADPSHQKIPSAWSFSDLRTLKMCFIAYLEQIFDSVRSSGVSVRYVQVGNEISNGFLWPYCASALDYVDFIQTAHYLCRQYFPAAQIVLHTDLSYSSVRAGAWYSLMAKRQIDYDLAGLSYYPVWHGPLGELAKTVRSVSSITSKPVILCEIGYMNTERKTSAWFGHWKCGEIAYSPEGQQQYLRFFGDFLQKELSGYVHPEIFYWGMFSYHNAEHFPVALFDLSGCALPAFYEINRK